MRFISGFFQFIALILMVGLVLALPLTLLVQGTGSLLLSQGKLVELLEEHVLEEDVIATIAQRQFKQMDEEISASEWDNNAFTRILLDGLRNLDHDQWVELTMLLAPTDVIESTFEDIMEGYYDWLDLANEIPRITIDFDPWKSSLKTNLIPAIELIMYTLPECTQEQNQVFLSGGELAADAASCRPAEPVYSLFIEQAGTTLPAFIDDLPDEYNIEQMLDETEEIDWVQIKDSLNGLAFLTQASWIAVLVVFVVAIPMGSRSLYGVFHWAGWPIFFAGVVTLLLAVSMIMLSQGAAPDWNPMTGVVESSPEALSRPLAGLFADTLRFIARPLLFEGAALILMGGVGIIIGIAIAARARKRQNELSSGMPVEPVQQYDPTSAAAPDDTLELSEEQLDQPPEDEDHPSGMFG